MNKFLTPGRYRGLQTTSLPDTHLFGIVAFDQRGSYRRMMPADTPYEDLVAVKQEIIGALAKGASAILTDPQYGLAPALAMPGQCGLLLALEQSGYSGDATYRRPLFHPAWTPAQIRKAGGNGVKLLIYYNPQDSVLADELDETIRAIVADCHQWDLPLFLEPMSYSLDPAVAKSSATFAARKPDIVIESARRLSRTGADVLKMEFPIDPIHNEDESAWRQACRQLSDASVVPWVLLSAGVEFELFARQLTAACEGGASGFLAGRAIWKEGAALAPPARQSFLAGEATARLRQLIGIAREKGRPWSEFYAPQTFTADWFEKYG